ncbi:MAG: dual specificity protein phosphatase family protein [Acidobacteria bacterium]|nr:dual specificity protein phosphatase family protein [Acidobacteriota bacterium]
MLAEIYWITENLAIMPHPRGNDWLEDEIECYRNFGVGVVVSLLERAEAYELGILREDFWCGQKNVEFINFPIVDRQVPAYFEETVNFVKALQSKIEEGQKIAIHCRQGAGRPAMIAAAILVLQGLSTAEAFDKIAAARGCDVPDTEEQREWVESFARNRNF